MFGLANRRVVTPEGLHDAVVLIDGKRIADVVRPDEVGNGIKFTVGEQPIYHRHNVTPYAGRRLRGLVQRTYVRGHLTYAQGRFNGPDGMLLGRPV